jgi:hypothetical protein
MAKKTRSNPATEVGPAQIQRHMRKIVSKPEGGTKDLAPLMLFGDPDPEAMIQAYSKQLQHFLDALIEGQPRLVETPAELEALWREAKTNGAASANRLIRKKAQNAALYWHRKLGTGGGRPRTEPPLTERFRLGHQVAELLPEFARCFAVKQKAHLRNPELLRKELESKGCAPAFLDTVVSMRTPLQAVCKYLSASAPGSYAVSLARYYREYREFYDWIPTGEQIKKLAG